MVKHRLGKIDELELATAMVSVSIGSEIWVLVVKDGHVKSDPFVGAKQMGV